MKPPDQVMFSLHSRNGKRSAHTTQATGLLPKRQHRLIPIPQTPHFHHHLRIPGDYSTDVPIWVGLIFVVFVMIIKGLLRRYQRWNPVHPTLGAFWGMGLGVGCGVGWGPGLGPEVIGYVGAGCGVGFSVGFTLVGVGIGLPANALLRMTYSAFAISNNALDSARCTALPIMKNMTKDSWNSISARVTCLTRETCNGLSNVKTNMNLTQSIQLDEMKRFVLDQAQSAVRQLEAFRNQHLSPGKGRSTD